MDKKAKVTEEEAEFERIFSAARQERAAGLVALLSRDGPVAHSEPDFIVQKLQLLEATSVKMRAKLDAEARAFVDSKPHIGLLEQCVSAALRVPRERRLPTTPTGVISNHTHEGLIIHIIELHPFRITAGAEQFLMCTTLVLRMDAHMILTGNFVFQLLNGGSRSWTTDNIETTAAAGSAVIRNNIDNYVVLTEPAILINFFFDAVPWAATVPITELKIV